MKLYFIEPLLFHSSFPVPLFIIPCSSVHHSLAPVPASQIDHYILYQGDHGRQGCYNISGSRPFQGIFGLGVFLGVGHIGGIQPGEGPFAGIKLDRKGNQGKKHGYAHDNDPDQEHGRVLRRGQQDHTCQEDPVYQHGAELDGRDEFAPQGQGTVRSGMLDGMTALVGGYGPRRNASPLSSTVGSEAWNSRDLKSRPH